MKTKDWNTLITLIGLWVVFKPGSGSAPKPPPMKPGGGKFGGGGASGKW